jgi:hypothetical protein
MAEGWGKTKSSLQTEAERSKPKTFSSADAKALLSGQQTKIEQSPVSMVLYGHDGVCKSGACLDSRFEDEIKAGKKVIVIDIDGSCGPLKMKYYPNDDNIIIVDPFEIGDDNEIDYVTTYNKLLAIVKEIYDNEADYNLACVALDGLDTLLKMCEYVMRYEDLKIDPQARLKDQWQWANRNRRYNVPIFMLRRLKCRKLFTTHYKELKTYAGGQLTHMAWTPDWEKATPGMMFQKVELRREANKGQVQFVGKVEKSKGALALEGKEYLVAEVAGKEFKWHGLKKLFAELEGRKV